MKKTIIASIASAGVGLVLLFISLFFIVWDRQDVEATPSTIITSILILLAASIALIILSIFYDKKMPIILIIPMVALFFGVTVFTGAIVEALATANIYVGNSVLDFLSPSADSPTVFALLLVILFIVSMVFVLLKKSKWASIVSITYISILLLTSFNILSKVLFVEKNMLFLLPSLAMIFILAAMIIYFTAPLITNNEIVVKKEAKEVEEKPVEEAKEEAKAEETTEAPVEEAKTEETTEAPVEEAKPEDATEAPVEEAKPEDATEAPAEETKEEAPAEENTNNEDTSSDENAEEEKNESNNDPFKNQYSSSTSIFDVQDENNNQ